MSTRSSSPGTSGAELKVSREGVDADAADHESPASGIRDGGPTTESGHVKPRAAKAAARPSRRAQLLEFAVLGVLHDAPLHGYELRKRLTSALGLFRTLSYGSLYPALKQLVAAGHLQETSDGSAGASAPAGRARITYALTPEGKEHFADLVRTSGPDAWDDDDFDVRFAFFSRTDAAVRLRILEGRRSRLEERLASMREASQRNRERMDGYTMALQQHGEDRAEREVRWLEELIHTERSSAGPPATDHASETPYPATEIKE